MTNYKVPYVNYKIQSKLYGDAILKEIKRVMDGGDYILRSDVEEFERTLAEYVGTKYAVGVNSCTDGMRLIFRALNFKPHSEVIVSGHTFLATLDAIVDANLKPILIDTSLDYNMNTELIEKEITKDTVAILPVHLNGRCCNMDKIMQVASKYRLTVIEDAAQALGAEFKKKRAGSFGKASAYSFFPAKLLGTIGDAGAICTSDEELALKLKAMRDYGRVKGQEQVVCYGQNSRLDNVHAAILNYKIKFIDQWIKRRREIAHLYCTELAYLNIGLSEWPMEHNTYFDTYQNFVIRVPNRDDLIKHLEENGVEVLVHWRTPLNKQKALKFKCKLPETERLCDEVISLPMYQELTDEQVRYVCDKIYAYFK